MKIIRNALKSELNLRTEMDFPTKGIEFVDINPLILNHDSLHEIIDIFVEYLKDTKIDYALQEECFCIIFVL